MTARRLPFADASFDCITFSNVLHHVPRPIRPALMRECARVAGGGPIYIKDHLAASPLDHARLFALDVMGNVPFGGMVKASYLTAEDWRRLAAAAGYRIDRQIGGAYRSGTVRAPVPEPPRSDHAAGRRRGRAWDNAREHQRP